VEAQPAIIVEPMEALRLSTGSYHQRGEAIGLDLQLRTQKKVAGEGRTDYPLEELKGEPGLPPGFSQ
jgi:hypothetical protein